MIKDSGKMHLKHSYYEEALIPEGEGWIVRWRV